jgi:hypothetical protein
MPGNFKTHFVNTLVLTWPIKEIRGEKKEIT